MIIQSEKLLVRCHGCKGTQIFKFDPETNEIEVFLEQVLKSGL